MTTGDVVRAAGRDAASGPPGAAAVRLSGLGKDYGAVRAVDAIDLRIEPGEVVALLGPNGAGKSTAIDMVLGLTTPDRGEVTVFGASPADAVRAGTVGAMLQGGALLDDATVGEVVGMVSSLHRTPMGVSRALAAAGISDLAGRPTTKLSGGQRQRVRFALAVVSDPDLLVLDEPTAAMDVVTRRAFWESMQELTSTGRTVVFATHYLEEAEQFADRVVFLRAGRIVADGSVAQVRSLAAGRTVRAAVPETPEHVLRALPGVVDAELRQGSVRLISSDSDRTLRALVQEVPDAHDIEVVGVSLDEAFVALTGATGPTPTDEKGATA
ncbi:ABC transporter ATP-binding protein [Pseudonocardia alni]|uniref:ABC transporter ATP-binding protein n=1 Tax=Pseudonocardia alni TaxID=33907 RepID=UPI0033CCB09C